MGKLAVHPPVKASPLGAGPGLVFVVDALGQKLTKAMPPGFAKYHVARITAKLATAPAPAPALQGKSITGFIVDEIAADKPMWIGVDMGAPAGDLTGEFKGYVPAALQVGDISTSTNPYAVTVDFSAGLRPADIDAAWPDVIARVSARLHKHQVCMQQDGDLRPDMVMNLSWGWNVRAIDADDPAAPGSRLVLDPYTFSAEDLQRNASVVLAIVRSTHLSVAIGAAS